MIKSIISGMLVLIAVAAAAQVQTQVIGDSIHLHSNAATAELILENSTKNVNGFLYNKGNGRTEFKKGVIKINDSIYVIGSDTLNLSNFTSSNSWKITGNSNINSANNFLGTVDNNKLIFKTNNLQRGSIWENGTFNIAPNDTAAKPLFRVYPNGDLTVKTNNNLTGNTYGPNNGIRYNAKYGVLELGTNNNFDTTLAVSCCGSQLKSALVINSDFLSTFKGHIHGSAIGGDNILVDTFGTVAWSTVFGENHRVKGAKGYVNKSTVSGYGMQITETMYGSIISGNTNYVSKPMYYGLINGFSNTTMDSSSGSSVNGFVNKYGGVGQVVFGGGLVNRTPYGTTLGVKNVEFTSLPYTGDRGYYNLSAVSNLPLYPLFALGNSNAGHSGASQSNALTILYNGRSQINTTGFNTNLTENDVTPKAALEIVSNNSGILIPRLTNTQRNSILSNDLQNGLLLYNIDSSKFQFYNGSIWKSLNDGSSGSSYTLPMASASVLGGIKVGANLTIDAGGVLSASGGSITASNGLTMAANVIKFGGTAIQNTNIDWNNFSWTNTWNTLAGNSGLKLSSASTAASSNIQRLLDIQLSGANAVSGETTVSGYFSNTHTGATSINVGIEAIASGGTTNLAGRFTGDVLVNGTTTSTSLKLPGGLTMSESGSTTTINSNGFNTIYDLGTNGTPTYKTTNGVFTIERSIAPLATQILNLKNTTAGTSSDMAFTNLNNRIFANEGTVKGAALGTVTFVTTGGVALPGNNLYGISWMFDNQLAATNPNAIWLYDNNNTVPFLVKKNGNILMGSSTDAGAFKLQLTGNAYISGKQSIGTTAVSNALLQLAAGTTAVAPLKFTPGANVTALDNGVVEYNGTNYFATSGGVRYTLAKTLTNTATLNFPSTATQNLSDLTIAVTGAADGDAVSIGVPAIAVNAKSFYSAWVSAANTVTVRFNNLSSAAIDPVSGTFRVSVIKY